jgi:hypothetical protein
MKITAVESFALLVSLSLGGCYPEPTEEPSTTEQATVAPWVEMPGRATVVAPNSLNEVYGLNQNDIWKISASSAVQIPGRATEVDVGANNTLWAVNEDGFIFKHDHPVTGTAWQHIGMKVNGYGKRAYKIAAGSSGRVYILSTESTPGGYKIYQYTGSGDAWTAVPGGLVELDVDNDGTAYGVNGAGTLFKRTTGSWNSVLQFGVPSGKKIARIKVGNGRFYAFALPSDYRDARSVFQGAFFWDGQWGWKMQWWQLSGGWEDVGTNSNGVLFASDAFTHTVYRYSP